MSVRFRPPLWAILGTLVLGGLFVSLGVWQLQRATFKQALQQEFDQSDRKAVLDLSVETSSPDALSVQPDVAKGHYMAHSQLLLDHQTRNRVPGYHVWTPMRLDRGGVLMVNRGWVAASPDRHQMPDIAIDGGERQVRGLWRPLPRPGFELSAEPCAEEGFPRAVSYPTIEQLACIYQSPVSDGVLLLAEDESDGYAREWRLPNPVPPSRHYGYAAQWFAFAATLLFLFIKLNFKAKGSTDS